jgi:hypothetical protein
MKSHNNYNDAVDHKIPAEVQELVLLNFSLHELAKVSTISQAWYNFFQTTKKQRKTSLLKELEDTSLCKKITLPELHKKLAPLLAGISI